ncbi:PPOX class F420-dependent oxidoreductase [Amycolatopsis antarctica]|uniref:PPOX class F420-dependent oxidoreductase n=1 Tax=Amycolatopsis antarctica TaxID=1854586 RepID=A0A263D3T9_9PSEU|nr:TIGR03668 family PPOX class F420-dependent oxidoreductase [Amycolatopsis antarctica]OZM72879.1 PPOX class F420-dependent oxidoreductase [Amycolatopsis antarctica]
MRLESGEARNRLVRARVARLATASPDGVPHLVPVTFALLGDDVLTFAVDHKPKRGHDLRRLRNIAANPAVTVLADAYAEDWSTLWWTRADGTATQCAPGEAGHREAVDALTAKYPQYARRPPSATIVLIRVQAWSGWAGSG